ncbi:MAG: cupredoxin domain-containing protein, partial [Solirubrobacteraceae bacterium]
MRRAARIALPLLALAGVSAAGVLPALAADQTVFARNSSFDPGTVALKPGETLTIEHDDGSVQHNLKFDDEPARRQEAGTGWIVMRTFGAGEAREPPYGFRCSLHAGMSGRVYVNEAGAVPTAT